MKCSEPWNSKCGKQRCTADEEDIRELELSSIMASSQLSIFVFPHLEFHGSEHFIGGHLSLSSD